MKIEQKISIPLFIIAMGNLVNIIIKDGTFFNFIIYSAPFFIFPIYLLLSKKDISNKAMSNALLILSLISSWVGASASLISATLFCFAMYIETPKKQLIFRAYFSTITTSLMIRLAQEGFDSLQTFIYIAGCSFIFIIYQHYIHPKKDITKVIQKDYLISPVKKEVVDIVHLIIEGCEYHEINDKLELNITADRVRRKVNEEIKRLGFKNREHMIFFLTEKGIIKSISYDLDIKNKSHDIL
jgi:Na+/serine symporter